MTPAFGFSKVNADYFVEELKKDGGETSDGVA
jgi:hypothetical protein